jgi:hypothetical protein
MEVLLPHDIDPLLKEFIDAVIVPALVARLTDDEEDRRSSLPLAA